MPHSVFISYSRREAPFVDVLLDALEDKGIEVWVDYHCLVPGKAWLDQIFSGIDGAEVLLLVVSKASMASKNVELEYARALEKKKRIILIIFEAVPLPAAFGPCEWLDFRGSFRAGLNELLARLDQPNKQPPAPQKGFKAPGVVWLSFILSLFAVVISIPGWWTFFLPIVLVPLPFRILMRNFHYYRTRFALLTLPVIIFLSWAFFSTYEQLDLPMMLCLIAGIFLTPALLILINSRGMRIWSKPIASAPQFANPYQPEIRDPQPVPFFIEYAAADTKYANAIAKQLTRFGHPQVEGPREAQASLVLLSHYKNSTAIDPQEHALYPIVIQDAKISDERILRIQWIDFRRGMRQLDSLAKLLPQPTKLLKALGVAPISEQAVYPRIIQMLDYYLVLLGFFSLSAWLVSLVEQWRALVQLRSFPLFVASSTLLLIVTMTIIVQTRRGLISREGRFASLGALIAGILGIGVIGVLQTFYSINMFNAASGLDQIASRGDVRGMVIIFMPFCYLLGLTLLSLFSLFNFRDLTRWFPYRGKA
jgi:hypothetical protein